MNESQLEKIERDAIADAASLLAAWEQGLGGSGDFSAAHAYATLALAAGQRLNRISLNRISQ